MRVQTGEGCSREEDGQIKVPSMLISLFLIVAVTCQSVLSLAPGDCYARLEDTAYLSLFASLSQQGFRWTSKQRQSIAACHI